MDKEIFNGIFFIYIHQLKTFCCYFQMLQTKKNTIFIGAAFAIAAAIIWSGNFIVAKGVANIIPPISLSFYRWAIATVIIAPFALKQFKKETSVIWQHKQYIFFTAFTGIAFFNTCIYFAGHHTSAINLAFIGTTTSPVISVFLAAVFLKEKISVGRIVGLLICITGILFLLANGSIKTLLHLQFSKGDGWILLAALSFAIYNTLVKKKPLAISAIPFLFILFLTGTLILMPFYFWELTQYAPVKWNASLAAILLYIGLGASIIAFFFWNKAVAKLGAARTAMFGYLTPVFSSIEAVLLLQEKITWVHIVCGLLVITGLVIANLHVYSKEKPVIN